MSRQLPRSGRRWRQAAVLALCLLVAGGAAALELSGRPGAAGAGVLVAAFEPREAALPDAAAALDGWTGDPAGLGKAAPGEGLDGAAEAPASAGNRSDEAIESGRVSWYGRRFHGRRTASGERFDMNAFTAAHPSLPFGTVVRVRNAETGKEVEVRINDRGPHVRGRIIDVSRAAAQALGLLDDGHAEVVLLKP